jgi:hypothetical protein
MLIFWILINEYGTYYKQSDPSVKNNNLTIQKFPFRIKLLKSTCCQD